MGEIVRLQKFIAMSGKASRRKAEELIAAGRVKVNGERVTEMGVKVEIGADKVMLNGEEIKPTNKKTYIMMNKPSGYVTTVHDQFDRPTVIDLLKGEITAHVVPCGRLDYETEGLLLLSDDGDFVYKVTHPRFKKDKTYIVTCSGGLSISAINQLRRGVVLDDGTKTHPAEVDQLDSKESHTTVLKITIHEGKNRQIRRMMDAVGLKVKNLQRVSVENIELGNLPLGRWRHLTSHEIKCIMEF